MEAGRDGVAENDFRAARAKRGGSRKRDRGERCEKGRPPLISTIRARFVLRARQSARTSGPVEARPVVPPCFATIPADRRLEGRARFKDLDGPVLITGTHHPGANYSDGLRPSFPPRGSEVIFRRRSLTGFQRTRLSVQNRFGVLVFVSAAGNLFQPSPVLTQCPVQRHLYPRAGSLSS